MRGKPIPQKVREAVRERSRGLCEARLDGCRWSATEMHHVKSRARGGPNTAENIKHLCWSCHMKVTTHAPGTAHLRTQSWQAVGATEADA